VILRLVILPLLLMAMPVQAGPGRCLGVASDSDSGQRLLVRLTIGPDGTLTSREAEWIFETPGGAVPGGLSLKIAYVAPVADKLGPVTSVTVNHLALGGAGLPQGSTAVLDTGTGKPWTAPFMGMFGASLAQLSVKTPWGGRLNPRLAETIETTSRVTATIMAPKKQTVATLVANPSDHGIRDSLFRAATSKAEELAAAPEPCR
jgi:hypothetical protein